MPEVAEKPMTEASKKWWQDKVSALEAEIVEARTLAQEWKDTLDLVRAEIEEGVHDAQPSGPGLEANSTHGEGPSLALEPLTFQPSGEPGMVSFAYLNAPGLFHYEEVFSFAQQNGYSIDAMKAFAVSAAQRAVDPRETINGHPINRLGVIEGKPTILGPFSTEQRMRVVVEIYSPVEG
jgi:hypothetical protein